MAIERDDTTRTATGAKKPWTTPYELCRVWAGMAVGRGRESVSRDMPVSTVETVFTLYRRTDVHPKMRVKLLQGPRFFEISAVQSAGAADGQFMQLVCQEVIYQ